MPLSRADRPPNKGGMRRHTIHLVYNRRYREQLVVRRVRRSDRVGARLLASSLDGQLGANGSRMPPSLPGQPWRTGYVEPFNSRIRDECLNSTCWPLAQTRVVISGWKDD
jgi:Integrase core domain